MSNEWISFLNGLEGCGISFEQVQLATDRQRVIAAAGITDPLSVAVVETEWQKHLLALVSAGAKPAVGALLDKLSSTATSTSPQQRRVGASTSSASMTSKLPDRPSTSPPPPAPPVSSTDPLSVLSNPAQLVTLPEEMQDGVMAREVLAACVGFGGLFIRLAADGTGFALAPEVPQSLRNLCQSILPVADAFVALRRVEASEYLGRCMVVMAIGEAVSEICTSYAHQISKLERWAEGKTMPLMGVVSEVLRVGHHLVRLRQVLPIDVIVQCQLRPGESELSLADTPQQHGGTSGGAASGTRGASPSLSTSPSTAGLSAARVLDHLFEHAERSMGSREDDELLMLLLRRALAPYLRMLHQWVHEGVLDDPYSEFFITDSGSGRTGKKYERATTPCITEGLLPDVFASAVAASLSETDPFAALTSNTSGAAGGGGAGAHTLMGVPDADEQAAAFERRFVVNKLMLPAFLGKSTNMVKMIFFAGKYCCLLRECGERLPPFPADLIAQSLSWSGIDDYGAKMQETFELAGATVIQLLFGSRVDLLGHLLSIKNFHLQGRSDWLFDFLDSTDALLSKPTNAVRVHSINVQLQAAIARSSCHSDAYHDLVSCSFSPVTLEEYVKASIINRSGGGSSGGDASGSSYYDTFGDAGNSGGVGYAMPSAAPVSQAGLDYVSCWELLQLDVRLKWPLTLVLDQNVMQHFNAIFRLLLRVKICERRLCALWQTNEVLTSFSAAYGIRHQFVQFLRQFQFYASHFVLEPLWGRLLGRIGQADDVFQIHRALHDFFTGVEAGLVLSSPTRYRSLTSILALAGRFCQIGLHSSPATLPLVDGSLQAMEDDLLQALSDLASPTGADYPQLVPLLTWVDFSGFYERNRIYRVQRGGAAPDLDNGTAGNTTAAAAAAAAAASARAQPVGSGAFGTPRFTPKP